MTTAEIFGTTTCTYCDMAKALLTERGIPFTYHDIDADESAWNTLVRRIGRWRTVPQVFVDDVHVGGFDGLKERLG